MGDGVLAYFGWPRAHEDDAERAVRAGARHRRGRAAASRPRRRAACRAGRHRDRPRRGRRPGRARARRASEAVVGETPNLAARLQELAAPGSVVIAEATRRLLGELFELARPRRRRAQGLRRAGRAWRVAGERPTEGRFEALHGAGAHAARRPRARARAAARSLGARQGRAKARSCCSRGEPGIGKSRLVLALRERLGRRAAHPPALPVLALPREQRALAGRSSSSSARRVSRGTMPPRSKLDKLEALLGAAATRSRASRRSSPTLLAIPRATRYPPLDLTPQQSRGADPSRPCSTQLEGLAARAAAPDRPRGRALGRPDHA